MVWCLGGMYPVRLNPDNLNSEHGRYDGTFAYAHTKVGLISNDLFLFLPSFLPFFQFHFCLPLLFFLVIILSLVPNDSKRAQIVLTELMAEKLDGSGITINSMHPGN